MNRIELIGNLTKDPELTEGANYKRCRFSLACDRRKKDKNNNRITDYFNCTVWNGLAEIVVRYCKKGNKLYVAGTLEMTKRKNEDNGSEQTFIDVSVTDLQLLTPKSQNGIEDTPSPLVEVDDDADIPF